MLGLIAIERGFNRAYIYKAGDNEMRKVGSHVCVCLNTHICIS